MVCMPTRPGEQFFYLTPKLQEEMYALGKKRFRNWGGKGTISKMGRAALLCFMVQSEEVQQAAIDAANRLDQLDFDACMKSLRDALHRLEHSGTVDEVPVAPRFDADPPASPSVSGDQQAQQKKRRARA